MERQPAFLDPPAASASGKASWKFPEGEEISPGRRALRSLAGGPFTEVYLAWDEQRCSTVVCKLLRPDQITSARALRKLRQEADLLARLAHPAIVRVFGATLRGARPYILLEHLDGPNLRRRIRRRGPLPLDRCLSLASRLAAALHYLREMDVVHLDVKPSNVVLAGGAHLIDFSLSRSLEHARLIRRTVGTLDYMAPELCLPGERGEIGPAADVWGWGATLYEALAGRRPFPESAGESAPDAGARYPQLVHDPIPLPGEVPPALREIIRKSLLPDPLARPSARDLVSALEPLSRALERA